MAGLRRADGGLPLIQLAPGWEEIFAAHEVADGPGADVALPPDLFNALAAGVAEKIARAGEAGDYAAIVTAGRRRRFLHRVLAAKGIANPVLSFEEVATHARPVLVGLVAAESRMVADGKAA